MHIRAVVLASVMALFSVLAPPPAASANLGLTPSHVFSLWTNINRALITVARVADGGEQKVLVAVRSVEAASFSDKTPGDVLEHVSEFRAKLDRLREAEDLGATRVYMQMAGVVTPAHVFLNTGFLLDGVAGWIVHKTEADQLIAPFYESTAFEGKTPSDVYGLVDQAIRRLDLIAVKLGL